MPEATAQIKDTLPVGIVAERRKIDHPWQDYRWLPVAVIPGAGQSSEWVRIASGDGWDQHHIATLDLELFRKETEAYRVNLSNERPSVYVVLRLAEEPDDPEVSAVFATASPYEAQDYLDTGEDIVEAVPMPEAMIAWVQKFIDTHHVDEPFKKRKRKDYKEEPMRFGKVLHPIEERFYGARKGRE